MNKASRSYGSKFGYFGRVRIQAFWKSGSSLGSVRSGSSKIGYKSDQPRFNITGPPFSIERLTEVDTYFVFCFFYVRRRLQKLKKYIFIIRFSSPVKRFCQETYKNEHDYIMLIVFMLWFNYGQNSSKLL